MSGRGSFQQQLMRDPRMQAYAQRAGLTNTDDNAMAINAASDPSYQSLNQQRAQKIADPNSATAQLLGGAPAPQTATPLAPDASFVGPMMPHTPKPAPGPAPSPLGANSAIGAVARANGLQVNKVVDEHTDTSGAKATTDQENRDIQTISPGQYAQLKGYIEDNAPQDFITARNDRDQLRNLLSSYVENNKPQLDLSPLAGLTAAWSRDKEAGKAVAQGYTKPESMAQNAALYSKLQEALGKADNEISGKDNDLARDITGGLIVQKQGTQATTAQGEKVGSGVQPVRPVAKKGGGPGKPVANSELDRLNAHFAALDSGAALRPLLDKYKDVQGVGGGANANLPAHGDINLPFLGTVVHGNAGNKELKSAIEPFQTNAAISIANGPRAMQFANKRANTYAPDINQSYETNLNRYNQLIESQRQDAQNLIDQQRSNPQVSQAQIADLQHKLDQKYQAAKAGVAAAAVGASSAPAGGGAPQTKTVGGKTYVKNPQTGKWMPK